MTKPKNTNQKKIKKFDYYLDATNIGDKERAKGFERRWDSCVYEATEKKLNEIIERLNENH